MYIIIHSKIIIGLLILAAICFATGLITLFFAYNNETKIITPTTKQTEKIQNYDTEINSIIITPTKTSDEIRLNDTIQFSLNLIPNNSRIKATFKIFQKEVVGQYYKNNSVWVDNMGEISKDDKREWKEIDITDEIIKRIDNDKNFINLTIRARDISKNIDKNYPVFEGFPQIIVEKIK